MTDNLLDDFDAAFGTGHKQPAQDDKPAPSREPDLLTQFDADLSAGAFKPKPVPPPEKAPSLVDRIGGAISSLFSGSRLVGDAATPAPRQMPGTEVPFAAPAGGDAQALTVPTDVDVRRLQKDVSMADFAQPFLRDALTRKAVANFDAQHGAGAAEHYISMDASPAPVENQPLAYGDKLGYVVNNPLTRGVAQGANALAAGGLEALSQGLGDTRASDAVDQAAQHFASDAHAMSAPDDAGSVSRAVQGVAPVAAELGAAMLLHRAIPSPRALPVTATTRDMIVNGLRNPGFVTAGALGTEQALRGSGDALAEGQRTSLADVVNDALLNTGANMVPLGVGSNVGKRTLGAITGMPVEAAPAGLVERAAQGAASMPALNAGVAELRHLSNPDNPAPTLGDVVTPENLLMGGVLGALGGHESTQARTKDVRAEGDSRKPVADSALVDALRKAGFTDEQIAAAQRDGSLNEAAQAATPPPTPMLEAPVMTARPGEAPGTPAQHEAAARARADIGLTPDVEQAQQTRVANERARVQQAEEQAFQHGEPGESPMPIDIPQDAPHPAAAIDALAAKYYPALPKEIGWAQEGGRLLRAGDEPSDGIGPDPGRAAGTPVGRTTWEPHPAAHGEADSHLWAGRPDKGGRLTPDQAHEAFRKEAAGEKLNAREQRFIDHAHQVARDYATHELDQTREFERRQADMDAEAIAQAQAERSNVAPEDVGDALTFDQWIHRAREAGASDDELRAALNASPNDFGGAVREIAKLVHDKEQPHATDAQATDGTAGIEPGGQADASVETGGAVARPQARGDLFAPATGAEHVRAAREAKDAERNGLNVRGRTDIHAGDGTLFEGRAPEQSSIPEHAADAVTPDDLTPAERAKFEAWKRGEQPPKPVHEVAESDLSPEDRALVQRTRERAAAEKDNADLAESMRHESAARGQREAEASGAKALIDDALGPERTGRIHYVHDQDGLPPEMVKRSTPIKEGNVRYGLHTPEGDTYIFTKHASDPARALWTAWHENGHEAFQRIVAAHPDVRVGNMTARDAQLAARKALLQNPTLAKLADVIGEQRGSKDLPRMAEEAVVELHAARQTGDWSEIARKYGVDVPEAVRASAGRAIDNFVKRVKLILNAIYARVSGRNDAPFTDAHVVSLLDAMHEVGKGGRVEADARMRDAEPMASEEPRDRAGVEPRGAGGPAESKAELPPRAPGESDAAWQARVVRDSQRDLIDGIQSISGFHWYRGAAKDMQKIGRGGLRQMFARNARAADKADAAFSQARRLFDKAGKQANLDAIDQWENGEAVTSGAHRVFFKAMQAEFDKRIEAVRAIRPGLLENVMEHYFPHLWEDPTKAAKWYAQQAAKRPLEGNKGFLKQRSWATLKEGMESGLKPVSTNPVDLALAKMQQIDKFLALHEFRKDLEQRGWIKEMDAGERVPYGYARVDDPAFTKAAGLQGYFAVPEPVARDLNNYLSPSLYRFAPFKALRTLQNFIMMSRLGWSAFHAGFTTLDNLVLHADVGVRYALQGDLKRSLITFVKTPASVLYSPFEGGRLGKQWAGTRPADANTAALLDFLEAGGSHWKMHGSDYNRALPKFVRGLQSGDYWQSARSALGAAGETGSWLIHQKLVPAQKMSARVMLAKFELDRVAKIMRKNGHDVQAGDYAKVIAAMHPDALRQLSGHVTQIVDERLGQMNYDNRFWNKTAREIAQTAVGALGWQVGTVSTVTGGVRDVQRLWSPEKFVSALDKGGKITDANMGRVTGRMTYLVTLALTMGGANAALQYMLTGQGPSEPKDYFFPKTGRKNADGSDERLQLPTYWMDHYKLATHPLQTAEHKVHPMFGMFMEAINNQDYYGVEIHDTHAPWYKQAEQIAAYVAKGFLPYSLTNSRKVSQNEAGPARQVASFFGVTNAPASVTRSKFQAFVSHNGNQGFGHEKRTAIEAEHSQKIHDIEQQVRNGGNPDLSGLDRRDRLRVDRESKQEVPAIQFHKMGLQDQLEAWDMATPAERERYKLRQQLAQVNPMRSSVFKRLPADEKRAIMIRLRQIVHGGKS